MSYILEALRKAESERERGLVPGLNAQPLGPANGAQVAGPVRWRAWAPWLVAGMAVLVAGALAWTWRPAPNDQRPAVIATTAAVPTGAAPPAAPTAPPDAQAPLPLPPSLNVATAIPTIPSPATGALRPLPAAIRASSASPTAGPVSPTASSATSTAIAAAVPPAALPGTAPASAPAEQRIYTVAELPEATRRELPSLSVAGASYSEHPANRLLIVNGNVFHEGDKLAPDLVLEHIDLKSAVLHFKGVRFGITY